MLFDPCTLLSMCSLFRIHRAFQMPKLFTFALALFLAVFSFHLYLYIYIYFRLYFFFTFFALHIYLSIFCSHARTQMQKHAHENSFLLYFQILLILYQALQYFRSRTFWYLVTHHLWFFGISMRGVMVMVMVMVASETVV